MLRGRREAAIERLDALSSTFFVDIVNRIGESAAFATVDLWCGRPRAAHERLIHDLQESVTVSTPLPHLGALFVLAAQAAADLTESRTAPPSQRRALADELADLLARTRRDPFAVRPSFAFRPALAATWAAESARLAGTPSVERWVAAAREWDRITRPHDAAYCRWHAAQVALTTGQGSTAHRLLRRAEHDAREHVPLLAAIRRTEADAQPSGQRA